MTRLAGATATLAVGHAVAAGAFVALINTPDANALMLVVSALLVVAGALVVLLTSSHVAYTLTHRLPPWRGWRGGLSLLPSALVVALVAGIICWLTGSAQDWWFAHRGEVDATAIAVGDVTRTAWLHEAVRWAGVLVQWVLVPAWTAAGLAWAAAYGLRHVASLKWLVAGLSPRVVLTALLAVVALVWVPWRLVYWRPGALTSTPVEVIFTGVKLTLIYLAAHLAWALVLDAAVQQRARRDGAATATTRMET